jgi:hypothetical protein
VFGTPERIVELAAGADDGNATMTADRLVLAIDSNRGGGGRCVFLFTRNDVTDFWANQIRQDALCSTNESAGPELSRDGLTLYYTSLGTAATWGTLMVATRASRGMAFPAGVPLSGTDIGGSRVGYPALSFDGLTLYYETESPSELAIATRSSLDATSFEGARPLVELNQVDGAEVDANISRDGQELYFSSDRTGGNGAFDLYRSRRTCTPVL